MASKDLETRFAHLLQPIRDLSKNWEVDLAAYLEDYIEQVEEMSITFDNGCQTMNFAEAAMIIQASACVYSKKVEYLYTMVFEVLKTLSNQKKAGQKSSVDDEGNDVDVSVRPRGRKQRYEEEEFLSLDDLTDHKNTFLMKESDEKAPTTPCTPAVLIPVHETNKVFSFLYSTAGEVLGSRADFKLSTSILHGSGKLLFDLAYKELFEESVGMRPHSTPAPSSVPAPEVAREQRLDGDDADILPMEVDEVQLAAEPCQDGDEINASMDSVHAAPFDLASPPPSPPPNPTQRKLFQRPGRNEHSIKLLDQHSADPLSRSMVKRRVYKMPPQLVQALRCKRKADGTRQPVQPQTAQVTFFRAPTVLWPSALARSTAAAVLHPRFQTYFRDEFQQRQAEYKQSQQKLVKSGRTQLVEEDENIREQEQLALDDGNDISDYMQLDGEVPDLPQVQEQQPKVQFDIQDSHMSVPELGISSAEAAEVVTSYEELVRQYTDKFYLNAVHVAQSTEIARCVREWEENIIPRLLEEEKRGPFDIHQSGTKVLDKLQAEMSATGAADVSFSLLCADEPRYERCRLFLATLQLGNAYNVEISGGQGGGAAAQEVADIRLKLLKTDRHHEAFTAPSANM